MFDDSRMFDEKRGRRADDLVLLQNLGNTGIKKTLD